MPTLQDVTLAHSQRLSELYRVRDVRLAEARSLRDVGLRALPAAARAYDKYDDELSAAREKQLATDAKAEAARSALLLAVADRRTDRFEDAQLARRAADVETIASKRRAEDAANRKYEASIADLPSVAARDRSKAAQDAEHARITDLALARRAHDDALAAAQQKYRAAIDEALSEERRDARDGERGYLEAVTHGTTAANAAKAFAEQNLLEALAKIPEAEELVRSWRAALTTIALETKEAEQDAFSRFRRDLETVTASRRSASS